MWLLNGKSAIFFRRCDEKLISIVNTILISLLTVVMQDFRQTFGMDNLGLLTASLRTHKQSSCIDKEISLRCPSGTNVVIELAQYATTTVKRTTESCNSYSSMNEISNPIPSAAASSSKCQWAPDVQYSLLQISVEACRTKQICTYKITPRKLDADPCPTLLAHAHLQYKCRPSSFSSKVGCENERIDFQCKTNNRLAIYSASYGRTQYESVQCPQPQGVAEETCLLSYATETVIKHCHGKRNCTLTANSDTFKNPCHLKSRVYLKVVYACVPKGILIEEYEESLSSDEYALIAELELNEDSNHTVDIAKSLAPFPREKSNNLPPAYNNSTAPDNTKEKIYIYIGGSISGILLSFLLFTTVAVLWKKRSKGDADPDKYQDSSSSVGGTMSNAITQGYTEAISEVEDDITLAVNMPPITVIPASQHIPTTNEVVRYGLEGITPRSLCQRDDSPYYYG